MTEPVQPAASADLAQVWETLYDHGNGKYQGAESKAQRDKAFRILEALAQQALQRESWQPIESAPKDGTWVLLCGGTTDEEDCDGVTVHRPVVAFCNQSFDEEGWFFSYWDSDWRTGYNDPTHWMRLPAAPNDNSAQPVQPAADALDARLDKTYFEVDEKTFAAFEKKLAQPAALSQPGRDALIPEYVFFTDAPNCLNTNDKIFWVLGWNECVDAAIAKGEQP